MDVVHARNMWMSDLLFGFVMSGLNCILEQGGDNVMFYDAVGTYCMGGEL